jgi:hypothetical protein
MKLFALAAFVLSVSSFADVTPPHAPVPGIDLPSHGFEMLTVQTCKNARGQVGSSMSLVVRHARGARYEDAILTQVTQGRSTTTNIADVVNETQGVLSIFTAPTSHDGFKLSIDTQVAVEGIWHSALFDFAGARYELLCHP